jgi:uncharacterized protein YicC (UPF0701 family)
MKTEKQLKAEIKEVLSEIQEADKIPGKEGKKLLKKAKQKLAYLKVCLMYIETHPNPEFLKKEKSRISNRIERLRESFDPTSSPLKRTAWDKEMGIPKLKTHLSTINFLLQ